MIGDDRDPRPGDWYNFAENAGYGSFVAYPGSEYTILPAGSGTIDGWGAIVDFALGAVASIFGGSSGGTTWQGPSLPQIPTIQIPGGIPGSSGAPSEGDGDERGDFIPGSIYEQNPQPETDWDEVYRQYQILNEDPSGQIDEYEDTEMAIDWGGLANIGIDFLQGQTGGTGINPNPAPYLGGGYEPGVIRTPTLPTKVTVDTKTGKVTTCKRRRRRRLLTEGDFNDLMRISTLPGNQNVRIALAKSIGRR